MWVDQRFYIKSYAYGNVRGDENFCNFVKIVTGHTKVNDKIVEEVEGTGSSNS